MKKSIQKKKPHFDKNKLIGVTSITFMDFSGNTLVYEVSVRKHVKLFVAVNAVVRELEKKCELWEEKL